MIYLLRKSTILIEVIVTWVVGFLFRNNFNHKLYRFNIPEVWFSPWNTDNDFNLIHSLISRNTLISKRKLYDIFCISKQFHRSDADFLEIGTLRGGSAALLANFLRDRSMLLWDNWGDIISKDKYFLKKVYSKNNDLFETKELLRLIAPNVLNQITFINKRFPCLEVISEWKYDYSLVHFDIYDKDAFESSINYIWPMILDGGVFIVSAYGSISLDPLTKSVNKFVAERDDCIFIQSQSGLGLLIKRARHAN